MDAEQFSGQFSFFYHVSVHILSPCSGKSGEVIILTSNDQQESAVIEATFNICSSQLSTWIR
jgi:hypothetical protein